MREIKFRAWLPVGEWLEDGSAQKYEMVGPDALSFEEFEPLADLLENCENLMQFTGLKDKNGKEIYEGDIYNIGDENIKYLVEWNDCGLIGKQLGSSSYAGLTYWIKQIEVIGNIYENPEIITPPAGKADKEEV